MGRRMSGLPPKAVTRLDGTPPQGKGVNPDARNPGIGCGCEEEMMIEKYKRHRVGHAMGLVIKMNGRS